MVNVTVTRVPGQRRSFSLRDGASVRDALRMAEISVGRGDEVSVSGCSRSLDHVLRDGDIVVVTATVKGNMPEYINVTIARVPGERKELTLNGGRQVRNAMNEAGWRLGNKEEIRVNSRPATLDTELSHNDTITLTEVVKGNN